MEIRCTECNVHLGEITGKIRLSITNYICSNCLKKLKAINSLKNAYTGSHSMDYGDLFGGMFGDKFRR